MTFNIGGIERTKEFLAAKVKVVEFIKYREELAENNENSIFTLDG